MENFRAISQTVYRPAQKNSWGGVASTPPPLARVKKYTYFSSLFLFCLDMSSKMSGDVLYRYGNIKQNNYFFLMLHIHSFVFFVS